MGVLKDVKSGWGEARAMGKSREMLVGAGGEGGLMDSPNIPGPLYQL